MNEIVINRILELFYILIGLQFFYTAWRVFRNPSNEKRIGTTLFWIILGLAFIIGPYIPNWLNGVFVLTMGALTITKNVKIGKIVEVDPEIEKRGAAQYGVKLFIPAIALAVIAIIISTWTPLGGAVGIGASSVIALIIGYIVLRPKPKIGLYDNDRLVQQIGTAFYLNS